MTTSNRKKLNDFIRQPPKPDELFPLLSTLTDERQADVSVVMLGLALLDHGLRDLLIHALPNLKKPKNIADLFDREGAPMGDVAAKIRLANALGLLTDDEADDFHMLRTIRNAFGHAAATLTFDTPEIAKAIDSLNAWKAESPSDPADEDMSRRDKFAGLIYLFMLKLAMSQVDWKAVAQVVGDFFNKIRTGLDNGKVIGSTKTSTI